MRTPIVLLVAPVVALVACRGDDSPPAPAVPDIRIAVTIGGAEVSPITRTDLQRTAPRARDKSGAAWLLKDVLPMPWPDGMPATAVGRNGVTVAYRNPADRARLTLFVFDDGKAYLGRAEPGAMFDPAITGTPTPTSRVGALAHIRIGDEIPAAASVAADAGPPPGLLVTDATGAREAWPLPRLAALPGASKASIPLESLAAALDASGAVGALELSTAQGKKLTLERRVLRTDTTAMRARVNRRGLFKVETVDLAGNRVDGPKLRAVTSVLAVPVRR